MKTNENIKKEKRLVDSVEQAQFALNILLQSSEKQNLERGISALIDKLKNPTLDLLLDRYPDLIQEYDLDQLLSGNLEIVNIKTQDVKTAGLLSCLQLVIYFSYDLKEQPDSTDEQFDGIRYVLKSITSTQFVHELLLIVISVIGADYYEMFQQKTQGLGLDLESLIYLEGDPELQEHIDLMIWFALVHLFLESVYVYFENPSQNLKNTSL